MTLADAASQAAVFFESPGKFLFLHWHAFQGVLETASQMALLSTPDSTQRILPPRRR